MPVVTEQLIRTNFTPTKPPKEGTVSPMTAPICAARPAIAALAVAPRPAIRLGAILISLIGGITLSLWTGAADIRAQPAPGVQSDPLVAEQARTHSLVKALNDMEADAASRCMDPEEFEKFNERLDHPRTALAEAIMLEAGIAPGVP
jgi:hypothetical protein